MHTQDRRDLYQPDNGRRLLVDRRIGEVTNYTGSERRSGMDRRSITDRRR